MRIIWRDCEHCGREFSQPDDPGRKRRFCGDACKQAGMVASIGVNERNGRHAL